MSADCPVVALNASTIRDAERRAPSGSPAWVPSAFNALAVAGFVEQRELGS
jgi:hypothetical protein